MNGFARVVCGVVFASACALAIAACGGGGGGGGSFVPPASGPQALNFTSFTVTPGNVSAGRSATLQYTLANPGQNSTSNVNLQAYISSAPISLAALGTALGAAQTISAIPPGQSTSGQFNVTIQPPPGVTAPAALFIAIVAQPTTSGAPANASSSFQVQLQ